MASNNMGTWRPRNSQYPTYSVVAEYSSYTISGSNIIMNGVKVSFPISGNTSYAEHQYASVDVYLNGTLIFSGTKDLIIGQNGQSFGGGNYTIAHTSTNVALRVVCGRAVSGGGTFDATWNITVPEPWKAPTQTFVTVAKNTTTGNETNSGNRSYTDNTHQSGATGYVGDSFTYTWDKNNEANVGTSADPSSYAYLARSSTNTSGSVNNHPSTGTDIHTVWGWTYGSGDLYQTYSRAAIPADGGNYLLACMYKHYKDVNGTACHFHQANGHYIQKIPTISTNYRVRSKKFYRSSPSLFAVTINSISITTNGYRIHRRRSGEGLIGVYPNTSTAPVTFFRDNGDGSTSNYSLNRVYQLYSKTDLTVGAAGTYGSGIYTRYQSPNLAYAIDTGYDLSSNTANDIIYVDGSFTKIVAKNLTLMSPLSDYPTSKEKMNFIVNWEYDGTFNNVRGDYRIESSSDGTTWTTEAISNSTVYKDWTGNSGADLDKSSTGWTIDQSGTTYVFPNVVLSTTGLYYRITLIPSSTDSAGYQIFGDPIQLITPKIYRVIIPAVPKVNYITSILPPIVGLKNDFYYKYQNTTNWGNYVDTSTFAHIRRQYYDSTHYEDFVDDYNKVASDYVEGVYTKTIPSNSTGSVLLRTKSSVKVSNWSDTEFTSAQSNYKQINLIAQKKYNVTTSEVVVSTTESTTLSTNIPFTLTLPNKTINGNVLTNYGNIYVDGALSSDFNDLSYTLGDISGWDTVFVDGNTTLGQDGTCTSISGDRTVHFNTKSWVTDTLTRGIHRIKLNVEILTYFDSSGIRTINDVDYNLPVNHVLFGSTGEVDSNELVVEIGELPISPTINVPSPAYFNAGQERNLTWTFSPNDWGCTDTTYNNRHYDYELYNPAGTKIKSGTIAKGTTSYTHTFTPYNADIGQYKFRLRETTVLGSSEWVESYIEIQQSIEPELSNISTSEIIALNSWNYSLSIIPGNNGSYKPVTTAPIARYKMDIIQLPTNLYNLSFKRFDSEYITSVDDGWYHVVADRTEETTLDWVDFWTNWNQYLKPDTDYSYVIEIRNSNVSSLCSLHIGNTMDNIANDGNSQFVNTISSGDFEDGVHIFSLRTKSDMKSFNLYQTICSRDFITLPEGSYCDFEFRISLIEGSITESEFEYSAYSDPFIRNLIGWTNVNNGAVISRNLTHNLGDFVDGTYSLYIPYERYYTTFKSTESLITQIVPPEVTITDKSVVEWVGTDGAEFNFKFLVDIFGWCGNYDPSATPHLGCYVEYSLDYGESWTRFLDSEGDNKLHIIPLTWLDEIWIRGYGCNPVDEDNKFTIGYDADDNPIKQEIRKYDMYSCYKAWLSNNNLPENWTRRIMVSYNNTKARKARKLYKK